jgi:hypothetical protein
MQLEQGSEGLLVAALGALHEAAFGIVSLGFGAGWNEI